jgi:S1-C subfamily serine protease
LQIADVILAVDGVPLGSVAQYYAELQTYTPGDILPLSVLRGDKVISLKVKLTALPVGYQMAYTRSTFGFSVRQGQRGLVIDAVLKGSSAERVGLHAGDMVLKIEGVPVQKLAEFEQTIEEYIGRKTLQFTVVRDNVAYLIELP